MSEALELSARVGRPTTYTEEISEALCEEIASTSEGLEAICARRADFPAWRTVYQWIAKNPSFAQRYDRAREAQARLYVEEITPIADDTADASNPVVVQSAKLRIETRRWLASKLLADVYGDKLDLTSKGEKLEAPSHAIDARIQSIVLTAQRRQAGDADGLDPVARGLLE